MANKQKQIGVMALCLIAAILFSSILVEASIGDRARDVFALGKGILPVLVNTAFFTVVIYLILYLFGIQLAAGKSQTILIVLIAVIVGFLVMAPVFTATSGKLQALKEKVPYFWKYDFMKEPKYFLWGIHDEKPAVDKNGDSMGILKSAKRMGIFIGGLLVTLLLISNILKVGGEIKGLNWMMAIIIAYSMANSPKTGVEMVIAFGEIVFGLLFFTQLKSTFGNNQAAGIGAVILVLLLANLAFPSTGGILHAVFIDGIWGIIKWVFSNIYIATLIIGAIIFFIVRFIQRIIGARAAAGGGTPP
ncbi:hypothetical protein HYU14_02695 [Candidatus Woesearchaeota archaeon]|nr:hypothetical protein [Candidatus Woesearchaeota archaeon]